MIGHADPFLSFHTQRLLDAGYRLTALRRGDYAGRYEVILDGPLGSTSRGDGEDLAEALSHAMIAARL